jgi:purine-binding chemotaxis protein CheW
MRNTNGGEKKGKSLDRLQGKYLTFRLGSEEYGLEILKVREIIGIMDITRLPRTPGFVRGVINLRGRVIPVIDLRLRFGMSEKEYDEKTCIIVVEIRDGDLNILMGVIVDSVSEVLSLSAEDLEPTPNFGITLDTAFIMAMAKGKGTVRALMDIDKVLTTEELNLLAGE